jgi:hypothetical protein
MKRAPFKPLVELLHIEQFDIEFESFTGDPPGKEAMKHEGIVRTG